MNIGVSEMAHLHFNPSEHNHCDCGIIVKGGYATERRCSMMRYHNDPEPEGEHDIDSPSTDGHSGWGGCST